MTFCAPLRFSSIGLVAALVAPAEAQSTMGETPMSPLKAGVSCQATDSRLANGLHVVVCPTKGASDVSVVVRYDVGSRDEPGGLEGLAHLAEHAMFGASKHLPAGSFWRLLQQAGATQINGSTGVDDTLYYETVPPDRLELALWLEAERMGFLLESFDEAALARDRAAVLNEYRDRVADVPLGAVPEATMAELYPAWHPYHHLPTGTPASIHSVSVRDVRAFLGTWYGAANATLVVTGDADPAVVSTLAAKYFGSLPARPPPERPVLPPLAPLDRRVVHVEANVTRQELRVEWVTPALGAPGDRDLDVVASILHERLQKLLVGTGLATSVRIGQMSRLLSSVFAIEATAAPAHTAAELLTVVDEALARIAREPAQAEAESARRAFENSKLSGLETTMVWAKRLTMPRPPSALFDGTLGWGEPVSAREVQRVARDFLGRDHRVVLMVHRASNQPATGVVVSRAYE